MGGLLIGVFYDNPAKMPAAELNSHTGLEVPLPALIAVLLDKVWLPEGQHAVLRCQGPYTGLPAANQHLCGIWLRASRHAPGSFAMLQVYLNTMMDVAPEDLITQIYLLLAQPKQQRPEAVGFRACILPVMLPRASPPSAAGYGMSPSSLRRLCPVYRQFVNNSCMPAITG